jgi:hypothetical protein
MMDNILNNNIVSNIKDKLASELSVDPSLINPKSIMPCINTIENDTPKLLYNGALFYFLLYTSIIIFLMFVLAFTTGKIFSILVFLIILGGILSYTFYIHNQYQDSKNDIKTCITNNA